MSDSNASPNPFKEEGFKLSSFTHKCCCVAVKIDGDRVEVRDTKNTSGHTLVFNRDEWSAFVKGVKNNEFDT